mgnify:CR=1 FL=1
MRQTERGGTERTGQLGAFLLALALLLVLTVFAHRVVLGLAAVIAGPLPAARTALSLSRKAMQETVPDETPGSIASEPPPESAPEAAAPAHGKLSCSLVSRRRPPRGCRCRAGKDLPARQRRKIYPLRRRQYQKQHPCPGGRSGGGTHKPFALCGRVELP